MNWLSQKKTWILWKHPSIILPSQQKNITNWPFQNDESSSMVSKPRHPSPVTDQQHEQSMQHGCVTSHLPSTRKNDHSIFFWPEKKQRLPSNHPLHLSTRSCSSCMALRIGTIQSWKIVRALAATFLHSTFWSPPKKKPARKLNPKSPNERPQ